MTSEPKYVSLGHLISCQQTGNWITTAWHLSLSLSLTKRIYIILALTLSTGFHQPICLKRRHPYEQENWLAWGETNHDESYQFGKFSLSLSLSLSLSSLLCCSFTQDYLNVDDEFDQEFTRLAEARSNPHLLDIGDHMNRSTSKDEVSTLMKKGEATSAVVDLSMTKSIDDLLMLWDWQRAWGCSLFYVCINSSVSYDTCMIMSCLFVYYTNNRVFYLI